MARLEDLPRDLRLDDLPEEASGLNPVLTTVNTAIQSLGSALLGNVTLDDNVTCERFDVGLSHGVAQRVLLKKLRKVGSVIGCSVGTDPNGKAHALACPPEVKPTSTAGMAQVIGYFRDPTAKNVKCSIWVEPNGISTSKLSTVTPDRASGGTGGQIGAATWASGAGFADVPNSSFAMTTSGARSILFHADVSAFNTGAGSWQVRLMQDGAQIGTGYSAAFNAVNTHQGWSFSWLVVAQSAGAHTYKLQFSNSSAGTLTTNTDDYISFTGIEI